MKKRAEDWDCHFTIRPLRPLQLEIMFDHTTNQCPDVAVVSAHAFVRLEECRSIEHTTLRRPCAGTVRWYILKKFHIGAVSFRAPCIVFFLVASAPVKHEDISTL